MRYMEVCNFRLPATFHWCICKLQRKPNMHHADMLHDECAFVIPHPLRWPLGANQEVHAMNQTTEGAYSNKEGVAIAAKLPSPSIMHCFSNAVCHCCLISFCISTGFRVYSSADSICGRLLLQFGDIDQCQVA
ncbi:uncharacterized protein LOC119267118 isoform X1 [Triticum dicoccoides]|uniref:uncharacterized protein LOC119267118 isoform X1 n=1 Tax=Triticum dicoccoides TaxID=85692 RepID=UPI00188FC40B|nr:uncharacterized protein LOC119267118 isoform X1 [Triticum dicoccoides]XP_037404338.1 uncharacterized protein LOC119267118 isoform X1 [Triticum dicoccoides]